MIDLDTITAEIKRLEQNQIVYGIEVTPLTLFNLIAQIQLACRHPYNTGESRQMVEELARDAQALLASDSDVLGKAIEAGWHRENDVKHEGPPLPWQFGKRQNASMEGRN